MNKLMVGKCDLNPPSLCDTSMSGLNSLILFQHYRDNKVVMHLTRSPEGRGKSHTHTKSIPTQGLSGSSDLTLSEGFIK